jgi:class 3 adenylate cyclase
MMPRTAPDAEAARAAASAATAEAAVAARKVRPTGRGWRLPIAAYLAVGFGGLVAVAVGAVLLLSLRAAQENTYELLRRNAELGLAALDRDIAAHLTPVRRHVDSIAALLESGTVPLPTDAELTDPLDPAATIPSTGTRLADVLLGAASGSPQITGFGFLDPNLRALLAGRIDGGTPGERADNWLRRPQSRLDIRKAATETGFHWGEPRYVADLGSEQLVARRSVRIDGAFRGVLLAAVSLQQLSAILGSGPLAKLGRPFILQNHYEVLALPKEAGTAHPAGLDHLPRIDEVGDPVLAGMWGDEVGDIRKVLGNIEVAGRMVDVAGTRYVFLYKEIDSYGAPWIIGAYAPFANVEAQFDRLRDAGTVGLAILVLAILLAMLLGRALGGPIRRLARAADAVQRLEIQQAEPLPGSRFREIDAACTAYNSMLGGLRWFETYVPKSLVTLLMSRGHRSELTSELREITVMFTDIVGFTSIGERLTAPQLADFLNRHFAMLAACIEAEGGTIDKYIGDSVMAFWGAPDSQPDHALRACRAVHAIARALAADNARRREKGLHPVRLRIGLHTGPAIAGNIGAPGRINYTLIGDTVNVSQRLEQLGKRFDTGEGDLIALASARTAAELPPDADAKPLGAHELRGRGEAMEIYRLV